MKNPAAASALILFSLFSPPGLTADLATTTPAEATQVSIAATELRPAAPAPGVQFAAVGEARTLEARPRDAGALRNASQGRDVATAGGLPSTPIALASLLLILCILIGRRNT